MQYGISLLGAVPIRQSAESIAPMTSQLLFGDTFKIKEERKYWSRVETLFDKFEGWVSNLQLRKLSDEEYNKLSKINSTSLNADLMAFVSENDHGSLQPIPLGAQIANCKIFNYDFDGQLSNTNKSKKDLVAIALYYLNTPFLSGGMTPMGIDNSGFTQMVYRFAGHALKRSVEQQSEQGVPLSFIEESEPGDLAFFDDKDGNINHVGIILKDNYIIHAYGKVRIDRIDHTGIFDATAKRYTHQLRVIKKIL